MHFKVHSYLKILPVWCAMMLLITSVSAQSNHQSDSVWVGKISRADLSIHFDWFHKKYNQYLLNDSVMLQLQKHTSDLHFVLIIGTWCSDSKEHVPAFYKVIDSLNLNESIIEMHAVNRKKQRVMTKELKKLKFEYVPTIIVYRGKKEIGRIIEDTKVSMEADLLELLTK